MSRLGYIAGLVMTFAACGFPRPPALGDDTGGSGDAGGSGSGSQTAATTLELLAGSIGGAGSLDGTGATARFNRPESVAADSAGNLYVADTNNNTIRKITPAGVVTTLAGAPGNAGSADGTGGNARFNSPTSVAADRAGNVYVADTGNSTIRKITSSGVVTTLAGMAGVFGSADATTGPAAQFHGPEGVTVDGVGNVYVADTGNLTIRKVTSSGVVTTLAGTAGVEGNADGDGPAARFNSLDGIAVDGVGNVYVVDNENDNIRKVTSSGMVSTLLVGTGVVLGAPRGVAVDGMGNIYIADTENSIIREVTSSSVITTLAGIGGMNGSTDGIGGSARFDFPQGVAVDSAGNVYVADTFNDTIRKITSLGVVSTLAGLASTPGSTDGVGSAARFFSPEGVAVDSAGNVYIADNGNDDIREVTSGGMVTTLAGDPGTVGSTDGSGANARFGGPGGVAVDSAGNVYVADTGNNTIRKISPSGATILLAGSADAEGSSDGIGGSALFRRPSGVALDGLGNLYVADTLNNTIRKVITSSGKVSTLAGVAGMPGSADGGSTARFNFPLGVAVDGAGNVYVTDTFNHTIRRISSDGTVTTLAGAAGIAGSADGGAIARFNFPEGIAVDSAGNVYVADTGNGTIRKITPAGFTTTIGGIAGMTGIVLGPNPRFGMPRSLAIVGDSLVISDDDADAILLFRHVVR